MQKLFDVIAPAMAGRNGGYTRIVKLGTRKGDGAEMCCLQWVTAGAMGEKAAAAEASAADVKEVK